MLWSTPPLLRNLTDSDIISGVEVWDKRKRRGERTDLAPSGAMLDKGKSSKETADLLGISPRKVERTRTVIDHATPETRAAVKRAENEVRKDFTRTEQVAIAVTIEALLEDRERRGRPPANSHEIIDDKIQELVPELEKGQQTRDFIARRAGLGSGKTYEQAKRTHQHGPG